MKWIVAFLSAVAFGFIIYGFWGDYRYTGLTIVGWFLFCAFIDLVINPLPKNNPKG